MRLQLNWQSAGLPSRRLRDRSPSGAPVHSRVPYGAPALIQRSTTVTQEIERKWLVKGFPKGVDYLISYFIKQTYLIADDNEVRIRTAHPKGPSPYYTISPYKLTIKGPGTISRKEVEFELSKAQYFEAMRFVEPGRIPIVKNYKKYLHVDHTIEISQVDFEWYYAEVEFDTEEEAKAYQFPWPDLIIKEITEDPEYKMKNYWRRKNSL